MDVVATFLACLTFCTTDTSYSYLCNTGNITFQIKQPVLINFFCGLFLFKDKGRKKEKMADLFLFVQLFFKFILKGEILCSLILPSDFTDSWKEVLNQRIEWRNNQEWDGCCWCDSLGHYLSSCCKCCMTLSSQVTAPQSLYF